MLYCATVEGFQFLCVTKTVKVSPVGFTTMSNTPVNNLMNLAEMRSTGIKNTKLFFSAAYAHVMYHGRGKKYKGVTQKC